MSFKTLARSGNAQDIVELKKVQGHLIGLEQTPEQFGKKNGKRVKTRNSSAIYHLQQEGGEVIKVWGCSDIDCNLLIGMPPKAKIDPSLWGALCRLTFKGKKKIKGLNNPKKMVQVEVDTENKVSTTAPMGGKEYRLNRSKKMGKK